MRSTAITTGLYLGRAVIRFPDTFTPFGPFSVSRRTKVDAQRKIRPRSRKQNAHSQHSFFRLIILRISFFSSSRPDNFHSFLRLRVLFLFRIFLFRIYFQHIANLSVVLSTRDLRQRIMYPALRKPRASIFRFFSFFFLSHFHDFRILMISQIPSRNLQSMLEGT